MCIRDSFITVQNLVGIDAVVLIICTFFDFASLAWKRLFNPQNWGFLVGKWGKRWGDIDPQRTRSYFWGFTRLCPIWWKSTKKCDRESVHRRTHTHAHTHAQTQNDFIICPMLYAIAMGQIMTIMVSSGTCWCTVLRPCHWETLVWQCVQPVTVCTCGR